MSTNKMYASSLTNLYTDEVLLQNSPQTKSIPKYYVQESFELIDRKEFIRIKKQISMNVLSQKISKQCSCIQILIVDDSELICQILKEILQNFRTAEAKDGVEALRAVRMQMLNECCQMFQLITMDCEMPILDGWTATKRIRKLGYNGPILGHTAYASYQDIKRCIQSGMNEVISKPSKSYEILNMVELMRNVVTTVIPEISPQSMSRIKTFSKFMQKKMGHNFSPECRFMIRSIRKNKTEIQQHRRGSCPECANLSQCQNHA